MARVTITNDGTPSQINLGAGHKPLLLPPGGVATVDVADIKIEKIKRWLGPNSVKVHPAPKADVEPKPLPDPKPKSKPTRARAKKKTPKATDGDGG